ncbi:response regulator [Devosia sp.]|uniref:response regulator n=1 Tax=Devosia sp. TaxID=1871048 RepID=UPI003262E0FD
MKPVVLFVDDEPNILSGLKRTMRAYAQQWDVLFCLSGVEALQIIETADVDVLVTDMRMPEMDGAQLLETVSQKWPGMFRFALSGEADLDLSCRIVGRSHQFLSKPATPDMIYRAIQTPLDLVSDNADFKIDRSRSLFDRIKANPGSLTRLRELLDAADPDLVEVTGVIIQDPSLAVRILQVVNSAYFGRPNATTDIARAVAVLGLDRISCLLDTDRLGGEQDAAPSAGPDRQFLAQAALIARTRAAANGATAEQMAAAYATVLFAQLAQESDRFADGSAEWNHLPAYVCALFGLPAALVRSLVHLGGCNSEWNTAQELGTLAAQCAASHGKVAAPHVEAAHK